MWRVPQLCCNHTLPWKLGALNEGSSAAAVTIGPRYWPAKFFTTQNKLLVKQTNLSFIRDKCCHLTLCLHLIEPNYQMTAPSGGRSCTRSSPTFRTCLTAASSACWTPTPATCSWSWRATACWARSPPRMKLWMTLPSVHWSWMKTVSLSCMTGAHG